MIFSSGYSKKERDNLEKLYTDSLSSVDEKELILKLPLLVYLTRCCC